MLGITERPNDETVYFLKRMLTRADDTLFSSVRLNMASAASRATVGDAARSAVSQVLQNELDKTVEDGCSNPEEAVDLLQAIGNLGETLSDGMIDKVINAADTCANIEAFKQATAYSLRDICASEKVQDYYQRLIETDDCSVKAAVITTLIDRMFRINEKQYTEG